jgi:hypothetical protein
VRRHTGPPKSRQIGRDKMKAVSELRDEIAKHVPAVGKPRNRRIVGASFGPASRQKTPMPSTSSFRYVIVLMESVFRSHEWEDSRKQNKATPPSRAYQTKASVNRTHPPVG